MAGIGKKMNKKEGKLGERENGLGIFPNLFDYKIFSAYAITKSLYIKLGLIANSSTVPI